MTEEIVVAGNRTKTLTPRRMGLKPLLAAMAVSGMLLPQSSWADNYVVTHLNDDGTAGSLRERIATANLNGAGAPHTITFQAGLSGTITLSSVLGQIPVAQQMTITGPVNGNGAPLITIDGNNASRILAVADGLDDPGFGLTLENLHLTRGNGKAFTVDPEASPGGCIGSHSALKLVNSIVSDCTAADAGGGIYVSVESDGSGDEGSSKYDLGLLLEQSTLSGNTVYCQTGLDLDIYGGGPLDTARLCAGGGAFVGDVAGAKYSTLRNNKVEIPNGKSFDHDLIHGGGGLFAYATVVTNSTITGNSLSGSVDLTGDESDLLRSGAGLSSFLGITFGSTLDHNTIAENSGTVAGESRIEGGGQASIWGFLLQSTISGNSVPSGSHGAGASFSSFDVGSKYSSGTSNSTFSGNSGASSLAIGTKYAGTPGNSFLLNSTIVANTLGGGVDVHCAIADCVANGEDNLVQSHTGFTFSGGPPITSNPQLGSLDNNGGFMTGAVGAIGTGRIRTHALSTSSPALNKGNIDIDIFLDEFDQRGKGFPRVLDSGPDIGAYEGSVSYSVPTLSQWGLGILSALMGLIALWRRKT